MNIGSLSGLALERELAKTLRDLLSEISWFQHLEIDRLATNRPEDSWDLRARGKLSDGRQLVLCIECKLNLKPSQFSSLVDRRPCASGRQLAVTRVLAMPRISPRLAALCQENQWSWYDLSGNCRIELPGVLLVERSANAPIQVRGRSPANLGSPEAGRVLRALLAPENAGRRWTQRGLVAHFHETAPPVPAPSLGLVNRVVQFLHDEAFVEPLANRGFRVSAHVPLLKAWTSAYRFDRHVRRNCFSLFKGRELDSRLQALVKDTGANIAYCGYSAADLQAPHVRQAMTWLYVDPDSEERARSALAAKFVDSGENLVLLLSEDAGVFYKTESIASRLSCTNAVQTYVDLVHAGGRGEEAAEALLEQRLLRAWSSAES